MFGHDYRKNIAQNNIAGGRKIKQYSQRYKNCKFHLQFLYFYFYFVLEPISYGGEYGNYVGKSFSSYFLLTICR